MEGSIPNEKIKADGYWAAFGNRRRERPADQDHGMDRPARPQGYGGGGDRHLRDLRRDSCHARQSHGLHGPGGLSWVGTGVPKPGLPVVNVPGCPVQPDNFMETVLYLLYQLAGLAPHDSAGRPTAAHLAVRQDRARRLRSRRLLRAGRFHHASTARPSASSSSDAGDPW